MARLLRVALGSLVLLLLSRAAFAEILPESSGDQLPRSRPSALRAASDRPCLIANGTDVVNNYLAYDTEIAIFCVSPEHLRPSSDWEVKISVSAIFPTILRLAVATRVAASSSWEIVDYDPDEKIKLHTGIDGKLLLPPGISSSAPPRHFYRRPSAGRPTVDERTAYDLQVFRKALDGFRSDKEQAAADILVLVIATAESVSGGNATRKSTMTTNGFWFDIRLDALLFNALPFRVLYLIPAAAACILAIGIATLLFQRFLEGATAADSRHRSQEVTESESESWDPFLLSSTQAFAAERRAGKRSNGPKGDFADENEPAPAFKRKLTRAATTTPRAGGN